VVVTGCHLLLFVTNCSCWLLLVVVSCSWLLAVHALKNVIRMQNFNIVNALDEDIGHA
jgi:hypothetical protein